MNSPNNRAIDRKDEVDIVTMLTVFWERKLVIVVVTLIFGVGSVIYAMTATHIYRASVVVTKVSDSSMGGAASLASQFGGLANLAGINMTTGGGTGGEWQATLKSRRMAEEFIQQRGIEQDILGDGDSPLSLWHAVRQFRERVLTINEDAAEGITTVSIDWIDPAIAADWANEFVALTNETIRNRAREESERNIEYLKKQVDQTNVVALQGVLYNLIEAETKTVMLANARAEYAFTVVDPAVPPEIRTSPNRKLIVLSGGTLGFFLGLLVAFVINLIRQVGNREQSKIRQ